MITNNKGHIKMCMSNFSQMGIMNYEDEKENIHLQKNEIICPDCKGHGFLLNSTPIPVNFNLENSYIKTTPIPYRYACNKCKGEGKLDWLENLVGKEGDALLPEYIDTLKLIKNKLSQVIGQLYTNNEISKIKSDIIYFLDSLKYSSKIYDYSMWENYYSRTLEINIKYNPHDEWHMSFKTII